MLFITHDIALARKVSDRMAVMRKGSIVEVSATNEIRIQPCHPYTRMLVDFASGICEMKNGEIEILERPVAMERYC